MSRRRRAVKRVNTPDPIYHDRNISTFINKLMYDGKKSKAETIFYQAIDIAAQKTKKEPLDVFNQALQNAMPVLEVKSRRVGGASYQIPIEVGPERRITLGMRWIINFARKRTGKPMHEKLALELVDAANGVGMAVKKKEDTHKMAEANKAFAHYRW
ncbi:MAG: 30S ribosomal protein S7 [Candidatus Infernicultor aquiphilus]|jgi:small subunit ribosomal protein S7|uniref:Small ribosomal subunit protein uS7 n=2 Tax=Candidatus Infernicultor aquiphilus TaxID=1805029 RepID=A0A1J5GFL3_9BACT|nr:MAG: 30S ribosomal protein S7 [Candidatus Atribacteria bacterium CG2_30_33_13]PIU24776.1 MAG: 30S ribosomal protein S7 [Candidatus Atribacteria bacterium CG08_land_8_20_14_0_20_33_29]PIW11270.1 MAG: 30S ribosomal protein S7 [Candidatus Atribacteria bacterium CG17_big_fil_post_rev_8_21_14_2_50_34_11]PIY33245.1 MAG: 30S ribosomal protein S7 [Candidatus Atribacteria bacterium CG_4_10_14_3_um_filter_34_13]